MSEANDHTLLAVLVEQVSALRLDVQAMNLVIAKVFDDHDKRLREAEQAIERHSQQLGAWAGIQAAWTAAAAMLAGYWGSRP